MENEIILDSIGGSYWLFFKFVYKLWVGVVVQSEINAILIVMGLQFECRVRERTCGGFLFAISCVEPFILGFWLRFGQCLLVL